MLQPLVHRCIDTCHVPPRCGIWRTQPMLSLDDNHKHGWQLVFSQGFMNTLRLKRVCACTACKYKTNASQPAAIPGYLPIPETPFNNGNLKVHLLLNLPQGGAQPTHDDEPPTPGSALGFSREGASACFGMSGDKRTLHRYTAVASCRNSLPSPWRRPGDGVRNPPYRGGWG